MTDLAVARSTPMEAQRRADRIRSHMAKLACIPGPVRRQAGNPGSRTRYVYFIQASSGLIKIGSAGSPRVRLAALQTASPLSLSLLGCTPGTLTNERQLHERFAASRSHGEWFEPSADLLALIEKVASS